MSLHRTSPDEVSVGVKLYHCELTILSGSGVEVSIFFWVVRGEGRPVVKCFGNAV